MSPILVFPQVFQLPVFISSGTYKILPAPIVSANYTFLLRFAAGALNVATVSIGRASVNVMSILLSLLQSSYPGLARAPIMCSHFPHGNEHEITCLARFFASCTALELIHEPRHSLLSPSGKAKALFFALCTALELIHKPRHSLLSPSGKAKAE